MLQFWVNEVQPASTMMMSPQGPSILFSTHEHEIPEPCTQLFMLRFRQLAGEFDPGWNREITHPIRRIFGFSDGGIA